MTVVRLESIFSNISLMNFLARKVLCRFMKLFWTMFDHFALFRFSQQKRLTVLYGKWANIEIIENGVDFLRAIFEFFEDEMIYVLAIYSRLAGSCSI